MKESKNTNKCLLAEFYLQNQRIYAACKYLPKLIGKDEDFLIIINLFFIIEFNQLFFQTKTAEISSSKKSFKNNMR